MKHFKTLLAAVAVSTLAIGAAMAEPKTLMLHQWATGSDAASIAKLGEMFTAKGGKWEQNAIAGHTANTLAKLRADVPARPPISMNLPLLRAGKKSWPRSSSLS
jgi:glucose/mannose transport system substrate-binding protein